MPPFHSVEKGACLWLMSLIIRTTVIPWSRNTRDLMFQYTASGPPTQGLLFPDPFTLQCCFIEEFECWNSNLIGQDTVTVLWAQAFPILFCCPALWIQGLLSARKAPEFRHGSPLVMFDRGTYLPQPTQILPQQLPKIPLVRNAIMRRSGCFVTHTVSLKRFFFFSNKCSVEESKGFPKPGQKQNSS